MATKSYTRNARHIDNVLYMGLRNDVSLLVGNDLSLWEQQKTHNPNMPLRGLKYFARLYAAYEEKHNLNEYGTSLLKLPTPRYVVFYVGERKRPYTEVLRLSDSYEGRGDVEVIATVINVGAKESNGLLKRCEVLAGYVRLVELVRLNRSNPAVSPEMAIDAAVQQCIDEGFLVDYLTQRRSVVVDMFMDEFDVDKIGKLFKEDGRREGRREGRVGAFAELVREGLLGEDDAATRAGVSLDEIRRVAFGNR